MMKRIRKWHADCVLHAQSIQLLTKCSQVNYDNLVMKRPGDISGGAF